jgi:exonuclease SbcD
LYKFIHASDLHLDSPLRGLEKYEGAPVDRIRGATRQAFNNLIDLAIDEDAKFVILAGDLFDRDWIDYSTGLYFNKQLKRLDEKNINVYIVRGNHDAENKITKKLELPKNVKVFSSRKAESYYIDEINVVLHGQSYIEEKVTEDISKNYPNYIENNLNIGVLHTCIDGREGHARYAPCDITQLIAKKYEYWALGHVHHREIVNQNPWIVFSGNIQGRHINEPGDKGCQLIAVENGEIASVTHRSLDVLRWKKIEIDLTDSKTLGDIIVKFSDELTIQLSNMDGRLLAARIIFTGRCEAHQNIVSDIDYFKSEIRNQANLIDGDNVWLESIHIGTRSLINYESILASETPLKYILEIANELLVKPDLAVNTKEIEALRCKLPGQLSHLHIDIIDNDTLIECITDAKESVLGALLSVNEDMDYNS